MRLTPLALTVSLLLAACAPVAPGGDGTASSSSVASSLAGSSASPSDTAMSVSSPGAEPFMERNGDFSGALTLTGYVSTATHPNVECAMDCSNRGTQAEIDACITGCPTHQYVFFRPQGDLDPALKTFFASNQDNSFVGDAAIGIGCKENGTLKAVNFSATIGERNFTVTGGDAQKLFASTAASPVSIRLHKEPSAAGRDAPDCYTHFTAIEVL